MPLDTNIALQARPIQFDNPMDLQAKGLTLRQLALQGQQAEREVADQKTLADLYRSNIGPDGSVNHAGVIQGMANSGLGAKIPAYQKSVADAQKSQADVAQTKMQTAGMDFDQHKKKLDLIGGTLSSLVSKPDLTHDDVIAALSGLVNAGVATPEEGAKAARSLPGRPEQLRQFLIQKGLETMEASKRLELMLPKYDEQDTGGAINQGTVDPMTGVRTAGPSVQKTVTPGEQLSAETMRRLAQQGVTYQQDVNGNIVAVPTKAPAGAPVQAAPVTDPSGAPLQGQRTTLNDSQSKALLFGSRMRAANKRMDELAAGGTKIPSVTKSAAESVPLVGGALGAAANAMVATPRQQQLEQAQRDFVNATLRRESGAAISPTEFDSARKQYFPQVGDSPEVIAQKKANRELAVRGMMVEVPAAQRNSIDADTQPAADVPPDIAAILKKHGAK